MLYDSLVRWMPQSQSEFDCTLSGTLRHGHSWRSEVLPLDHSFQQFAWRTQPCVQAFSLETVTWTEFYAFALRLLLLDAQRALSIKQQSYSSTAVTPMSP